jgi:hypothetical protein
LLFSATRNFGPFPKASQATGFGRVEGRVVCLEAGNRGATAKAQATGDVVPDRNRPEKAKRQRPQWAEV